MILLWILGIIMFIHAFYGNKEVPDYVDNLYGIAMLSIVLFGLIVLGIILYSYPTLFTFYITMISISIIGLIGVYFSEKS